MKHSFQGCTLMTQCAQLPTHRSAHWAPAKPGRPSPSQPPLALVSAFIPFLLGWRRKQRCAGRPGSLGQGSQHPQCNICEVMSQQTSLRPSVMPGWQQNGRQRDVLPLQAPQDLICPEVKIVPIFTIFFSFSICSLKVFVSVAIVDLAH